VLILTAPSLPQALLRLLGDVWLPTKREVESMTIRLLEEAADSYVTGSRSRIRKRESKFK
jgi:hypothetical protein